VGRAIGIAVAVGLAVAVAVAVGLAVAVAVGLAVAVVAAVAVGVVSALASRTTCGATIGVRTLGLVTVTAGELAVGAAPASTINAPAAGSSSRVAACRLFRKKTSPIAPAATQPSATAPMATSAHPPPLLFLLNPGPGRVLPEGDDRHGG
jgi:hypothetical protein